MTRSLAENPEHAASTRGRGAREPIRSNRAGQLSKWAGRCLGLGALAAIVAASPFASMASEPAVPVPVPSGARIAGRVVARDGKTPIRGAIVRACHLEQARLISARPADERGDYEIADLPLGYIDLLVETPEGIFVANQVIRTEPESKTTVQLVLSAYSDRPASWWGERAGREVAPCTTQAPVGVAEIRLRPGGKAFLKSPTGIAILAGGAGAALLAIASGDDEPPASPSQ